MAETWLIDGYNVLCVQGRLPKADALSQARDALAAKLADFAGFMHIRCVLVFDAHMVKGGKGSTFDTAGLTVVYTRAEETADSYIERTCAQLVKAGEVVRVCTGDGMQQHIVLGLGGLRMSVRELDQSIRQAVKERKRLQKHTGRQMLYGRLDAGALKKLERLRTGEGGEG